MPLPEIQFTWYRAKDGNRWVGTVLTDGLPPGVVKHYGVESFGSLKDRPAAFRDFADLSPTREAIKDFADRFGLLGLDERIELPIVNADGTKWTAHGEGFSAWKEEIRSMHDAVSLWENARSQRHDALARVVRWEKGLPPDEERQLREELARAGYESQAIGSTIEGLQSHARVRMVLPNGDLTVAAWHPEWVDLPCQPDDLSMAAWTVLLPQIAERLKRIGAGLVWDRGLNHPVLQLHPRSLLDALWLQFARAIANDEQFKRCENPRCRRYFHASSEDSRRKYCPGNSACKMAASRARNPTPREATKHGTDSRSRGSRGEVTRGKAR